MKRLLFILAALVTLNTQAQTIMSLEEVFKQALQNNFQLQVLENQVEIAENSANPGNAGLLPDATLSGSYGVNVTNTRLEFAGDNPAIEQDGALSSNTNAAANVSYVLFNGLNGQRTYQRLKLNARAVNLQSQAQIESTLLQVANAYYALARAIEQVEIAESNVAVSKNRYSRAKVASDLGTLVRSELLAARVDLTTDSSAFFNAQLQQSNAQRDLELFLGSYFEEEVLTEKVEPTLNDWTLEGLMEEGKRNNATLKNTELQKALAEKDYQLSWSSAFPQLTLTGGYSYNNQQAEAGFVLNNTAVGWNGTVGLTYPIFTGFRNRTQRQNAQIAIENSELLLKEQQMTLNTNLRATWNSYQQRQQVFAFEQNNLVSAELNLDRREEQYRAGLISSTEFREAQVALAVAQQRMNNAGIDVKLFELELMRLSGQIMTTE